MSPDERERLLVTILDALSDPRSAMGEGRRHKKAKGQAIDTLTLHFGSTGRVIYLAEELTVLYPGEEVFSPDILAVLDVPQPEDDPRMAWVVADERRGLDLVIEVLHHGDRNKDLVTNVERYARLHIPEYFVYDRLRSQHSESVRELSPVFAEQLRHHCGPLLVRDTRKPQEHHPAMGSFLAHHEITEVLVVRDQDRPFFQRTLEHLTVTDSGRLLCDVRHVKAVVAQSRDDCSRDVLVRDDHDATARGTWRSASIA